MIISKFRCGGGIGEEEALERVKRLLLKKLECKENIFLVVLPKIAKKISKLKVVESEIADGKSFEVEGGLSLGVISVRMEGGKEHGG
jgi:hypothetical protein